MIDKDFEMACEMTLTITRKQSLIFPCNYFARYAELYGVYERAQLAWQRLEDEFAAQTGGAHRFTTLQAFQSAMWRHHTGEVVRSIVLKLD